MSRLARSLLFAALTCLPAAAYAEAPERPSLALTFSPVASPEAPDLVDSVWIRLELGGRAFQAGETVLRVPLVSDNVDTVADQLLTLHAFDAAGPLPLAAHDTGEASDAARQWVAERATHGAVTVEYEVPADATLPPRGPAPPYEFSNDGGGVSAAGQVFMLLPPETGPFTTRIDFDLSRAPEDSRAFSSLGEGRAEAVLSAEQLRETFIMAGAVKAYTDTAEQTGFFGVVQGEPPFNGLASLAWSAELYQDYAAFFGQEGAPPYGVFLRHNPVNAGGGVGLHRSFVTTFGEHAGNSAAGLRSTLAHEMFHTFQPYITEPGGLESAWFAEGLAVFYQSRLPARYGMVDAEAFLDDLNFHAGRYYSSLMANEPNTVIAERFWADTRVRTLPYDRGMLYFATVDHAVRTASGGARSLDDLMLEMLRRQRDGRILTNAAWEDVLRAELGPDAVSRFHAFLNGAMPVPESDAFGPCFKRTTDERRRYELGFDTAVLAEPERVVRGLVPGSNAEQAGLQDGDVIVNPVPQDQLQGSPRAELTLLIQRGAEPFEITYLPRGETVEIYQWERVEGVPAADCRF